MFFCECVGSPPGGLVGSGKSAHTRPWGSLSNSMVGPSGSPPRGIFFPPLCWKLTPKKWSPGPPPPGVGGTPWVDGEALSPRLRILDPAHLGYEKCHISGNGVEHRKERKRNIGVGSPLPEFSTYIVSPRHSSFPFPFHQTQFFLDYDQYPES